MNCYPHFNLYFYTNFAVILNQAHHLVQVRVVQMLIPHPLKARRNLFHHHRRRVDHKGDLAQLVEGAKHQIK